MIYTHWSQLHEFKYNHRMYPTLRYHDYGWMMLTGAPFFVSQAGQATSVEAINRACAYQMVRLTK